MQDLKMHTQDQLIPYIKYHLQLYKAYFRRSKKSIAKFNKLNSRSENDKSMNAHKCN